MLVMHLSAEPRSTPRFLFLLAGAMLLSTVPDALAWTPPDLNRLLAEQQAADSRRETAQLVRLRETRAALAAARGRATADDSRHRELQRQLETLEDKRLQRQATLVSQRTAVSDLYTTARQTAGDLIALLRTASIPPPGANLERQLQDLAASPRALDLDSLAHLWEALHVVLSDTATQSRQELSVQVAPGKLVAAGVTRFGAVLAVAGNRVVEYDHVAGLYRALPAGSRSHQGLVSRLSASNHGIVYAPFQPGAGTPAVLKKSALQGSVRESGPIGYLIVLLGVIGLAVFTIRTVLVLRLLRAEQTAAADSPSRRLRLQCDSHLAERSESLAGWLNAAVRTEVRRVAWGHTVLSVIIGVAPLLGLLGTVTGMIVTFHALRIYGSGDPVLMADGIAQALNTTLLGLLVAIPLLLGQRWLSSQTDGLIRRLDASVLALVAQTRSRR